MFGWYEVPHVASDIAYSSRQEENRDHFQQLTEMARRKPKEQDNGQD